MRFVLWTLALLVSIPSAFASDYSWDVVPIIPSCQDKIACTKDEMAAHIPKSGIVPRLQQVIEKAILEKAHISLAFMSFTEESLWKSLCEAGRSGVTIEGFFASRAGAANGLGTRLERDCQASAKAANIKMYYMGMPEAGKSSWRLHHNKFFLVDFGPGKNIEIAFGSANLSTQGLTVNYENWNFFSGRRELPFVQNHLCDLEAMRLARKAGKAEDDPKVFRTKLDACLSDGPPNKENYEKILKRDGVVAMFAPDKKDRAFAILADNIGRVVSGGRIRMAVYFFMHRPLIDALTAAVKRGVEVELLVDDDIYLGGSIATQKKIWESAIKPSVSGFKIRSFDTNESIFQLQHNKYLMLEGVDRAGNIRVFGGAGQFTLSAFQNNYENFFLTDDLKIVRAYSDLFTQLWNLGADVAKD